MLLDAVAFSNLPPTTLPAHHRVLLKEVIHHIPEAERSAMFRNLAHRMAMGGVLLVVTRPQEVDYPLFALARQVVARYAAFSNLPFTKIVAGVAGQPTGDGGHCGVNGSSRAAGVLVQYLCFYCHASPTQVTVHRLAYHARVPVDAWLRMVANRFWSTFAGMNDAQLSDGLAELRMLAGEQVHFCFEDRLLLLQAQRPGNVIPCTPTCPIHVQYAADGFVGPINILTAAEAAAALSLFDAYAAQHDALPPGTWRFKSHLVMPWIWQLVHHPAIVEVPLMLPPPPIACHIWSYRQ